MIRPSTIVAPLARAAATRSTVANPVKVGAPALGPGLQYFGGPVIASVEVVCIFWGADWTTGSDVNLAVQIEGFFDFAVTSVLMDMLAEYSTKDTKIEHGTRLASARISTSEPGSKTTTGRAVTDSQVQTALQGWIAAGTVAATTANTLYFVFLPPNVTSADPVQGLQSCVGQCGYHYFNGGVYYAVIPYLSCSTCQLATGLLDSYTVVCSHEMAEAITDPTLTSWFDPNSNAEIGDLCAGNNLQTTRVGNYLIQQEWSNSGCGCALSAYVGFVPGQKVNEIDSTPAPLAACEFDQRLYLFWKANDPSNRIYVSAASDGRHWPAGALLTGVDSTPEAPACCAFNGRIYAFWKANDASNSIYFSVSGDGASWSNGQKVNGVDSTPRALSACVFNNLLYLFFKANDASNSIYYTASADGLTWPAAQKINGVDSTPEPPASCVFNGQLYVFFTANDRSHAIYFSASGDGQTWPAAQKINQVDSTPVAVSANLKCSELYVFWKANDPSNVIYFSTSSDGTNWGNGKPFNDVDSTRVAPTSATYFGLLEVVWKSNDDSNAIYHSILNG
jgi:hypothetical protein